MEILDKNGKTIKRKKNESVTTALTIGIILIAAGAILVLANMGVITPLLKKVLISWQMLLIVVGAIELFKKHFTQGFIIFMIGLFFLMPRLIQLSTGHYDNAFTKNYWPVFLIIVGITIIISIIVNKNNSGRMRCHSFTSSDEKKQNANGQIDYSFIFSGAEQVYMDPVFKGGNISVLFGGTTLDLRNTTLPEGITTLKIDALFGGVTLLVPTEWNVEVSQHSILGGFADNRAIPYTDYSENCTKLVVRADCMFGGGEIK